MRSKDIQVGGEYAVTTGGRALRRSLESLASKWNRGEGVACFVVDEVKQAITGDYEWDSEARKLVNRGDKPWKGVIDVRGHYRGSTYSSTLRPNQVRATWAEWMALRGPEEQKEEQATRDRLAREEAAEATRKAVEDEWRAVLPGLVRWSRTWDKYIELKLTLDGAEKLLDLLRG